MSWRWRWSEPSSYFKTSTWWRMKCKFKMSQLEEFISLKLAMEKWSASSRWAILKRSFDWLLPSIWLSWICEYALKKKLPHSVVRGSIPQDFIKASTTKNGAPSCRSQDCHHRAQVECARLRFALDRVSFSPVSWCSWRPVYSLVVVLSRGLSSE